jgi:DNA helicase-2/ATP-dependent DNA helicase PcrA
LTIAWGKLKPPAAAADQWPKFIELMQRMAGASDSDVALQIHLIRQFYAPLLEQRYDHAAARLRDLEQLEQLAGRFANRGAMLTEIALDPPTTPEDLAGEPLLDEDYLVLSTIHSAKGLEWDAVYVIHASDGNIPSDMTTASPEQIEEERRLFYVALTRAKDWLYVCFPQKYFHAYRGRSTDQFGYAQLSRFLPNSVKEHFACSVASMVGGDDLADESASSATHKIIRQQVRALWS